MEDDKLSFPVGVEIETTTTALVRNLPENWVADTDPSCGSEFKSGKIETAEALFAEIPAACKVLIDSGAEISGKCGLHVHLGFNHIPDLSAKYRVFRFFSKYEKVILDLANPWSTRKDFCKALTPEHWNSFKNGQGFTYFFKVDGRENRAQPDRHDRYFWFNGAATFRHGTTEFRCHNGTLDSGKILDWVSFLQCIYKAVVIGGLKVEWGPVEGTTAGGLLNEILADQDPIFGARAERFVRDAI